MPLLGSSKIAAFSATANPERAKAFYRDQLGLTLISDEPYALVFDANGTMLRVQKVKEVNEAKYTTLGWNVPDIAAMVDELEKTGVKFEHYGMPGQDAKGIWTPPGSSAKVAWFKDPDGNILSLAQFA
jgi:catechol 2,3-dioxygenase-like lactoylglutathione lyase family enzyme